MQVPRPILRICQEPSLRRAAILSQCSPYSVPAIRIQGSQCRAQHNKHGPYKEYFQRPGFEPKPDLTPYVREPQPYAQTPPQFSSQYGNALPSDTQGSGEPDTQQGARGLRRLMRPVRGLLWFALFLQLGFMAGVGAITWEYLSPAFEPGSPEEEDLIEEILDALDTHPMVEDLRDKEWVEIDPFTPDIQHGLKGRHILHQTLGGNNPQGVFMKVFHHPKEEYTMLVFFLGFGVEGWPDVIHGGLTSTLLEEGLSKHIAYYYSDYLTKPKHTVKIDFQKPCRPGEVYGVLVTPPGRVSVMEGNVAMTELHMTGLLVQLAGAPLIQSEFDIATNTEKHTVGIPTQRGKSPQHASCLAQVRVVLKPSKIDQTAYQVGGIDNEGFVKALDFLKKQPGFKDLGPAPAEEESKEDD